MRALQALRRVSDGTAVRAGQNAPSVCPLGCLQLSVSIRPRAAASQNGAKTVAGFQKAKKQVQKQAQKVLPNQVLHRAADTARAVLVAVLATSHGPSTTQPVVYS